MSANVTLLAVVAVLYACGVYLLLERSLTRLLLGFLLVGNATNLLLLTAGGPGGGPPIVDRSGDGAMADPLVQALILTAIVITMGLTAFFLALTYRAYANSRVEEIQDDPEASAVASRSDDRDQSPDCDRPEIEDAP